MSLDKCFRAYVRAFAAAALSRTGSEYTPIQPANLVELGKMVCGQQAESCGEAAERPPQRMTDESAIVVRILWSTTGMGQAFASIAVKTEMDARRRGETMQEIADFITAGHRRGHDRPPLRRSRQCDVQRRVVRQAERRQHREASSVRAMARQGLARRQPRARAG